MHNIQEYFLHLDFDDHFDSNNYVKMLLALSDSIYIY